MPRGPRTDSAGMVFHVMNRGAARRTIFETARDYRYFLSRVAYAVRRRQIDVLSFALMTTHYHMQVLSHGHLSEALGRIQNEYSRHFNRTRKRDGPLFRGRFLSKPIETESYFGNTFAYIDENPVQARLVTRPEEWPWGSAIRFACGRPGPWLSTEARDRLGVHYGRDAEVADEATRQARAALIEARLRGRSESADPLDDLVSRVPSRVWAWMVRKAQLADGTDPGIPVAGAEQVISVLMAHDAKTMPASVKLAHTKRHPQSRLLTVGLLRDLAALPYMEIGKHVHRSPANVKRLHELHCRAILELPDYAALVVALTDAVVAPFRRTPYTG